jgi:hypothetical protein
MARLLLLLLLLVVGFVVVRALLRRQSGRSLPWHPERITATVRRGREATGEDRQYLNLDRVMPTGEPGWTHLQIAIPQRWEVKELLSVEDGLIVKLGDGRQFYVNQHNVGKLSEAAGAAERSEDEELERVWKEYAKVEAA